MDISNFVARLKAVDWEGFQRPPHDRSAHLPKSIESLAKLSDPKESQQTYDRVLHDVGNNHAGTLYPAAVAAVDFIAEVALEGPTSQARQCAAEILIDMNIFDAEPGFEVVAQPDAPQGNLTDLVRSKIHRSRNAFDRMAKLDSEPKPLRNSFIRLVAGIDKQRAI